MMTKKEFTKQLSEVEEDLKAAIDEYKNGRITHDDLKIIMRSIDSRIKQLDIKLYGDN